MPSIAGFPAGMTPPSAHHEETPKPSSMPCADVPLPPLWREPWREAVIVVLDLEMTGRDFAQDRICEVALERRTSTGTVLERFESLVRPEGATVGASEAIHGISDAALASAPTLRELAPTLRDALEGAVLVGHRIAYDLSFLAHAAERGEIDHAPIHALDTSKLARRCFHGLPGSLRGLCEALKLSLPTHRAMPDVQATRELFDRLVVELTPRTAADLWIAQQVEGKACMRDDVHDALSRAWTQQRAVELTYRVPGRAPTTQEFEVWSLGEAHVEGRLVSADAHRVLRGDRILRVTALDRIYSIPERRRSALPLGR